MGFLDRLFGSDQPARQAPPVPRNTGYGQPAPSPSARPSNQPPQSEDERAIERYRYLLRTAPPETIEQVHAEAFSKLTEPQRQQVLAELSAGLTAQEQPRSSNPQDLARAATRAEYMNPGFMERTLGPQGDRQGPGMGSMIGSSILGTVVGYVIGSAIVSAFMAPAFAAEQGSGEPSGDAAAADGGPDAGADGSWGDAGAGDMGGFGDFGGDFGF
jgi:hypothetical protein